MSSPRLYRGKTQAGEWVKGWYFETQDGKAYIFPYYAILEDVDGDWMATGFIEVLPDSVGQATGLKDRHGKGQEVWENDIFITNEKDDEGYHVVEWRQDEGRFEFDNYRYRATDVSLLDAIHEFGDQCRVIGNLTDNKNLLEVG